MITITKVITVKNIVILGMPWGLYATPEVVGQQKFIIIISNTNVLCTGS